MGVILAAVLHGQDRAVVCEHGTRGESRAIDLRRVEETYKKMEENLSDLTSRATRLSSRPQEFRREPKGFDSGLPRGKVDRRRTELPKPVPKRVIGAAIYVGEPADLKRAEREGIEKEKIYLQVRGAEGAGAATPALVKFFGIEAYPVRIFFEDATHVVVEGF